MPGLARDPPPMKCGLLWYTHISKTAGTTTTTYLRKYAPHLGWQYMDSLFIAGGQVRARVQWCALEYICKGQYWK